MTIDSRSGDDSSIFDPSEASRAMFPARPLSEWHEDKG
jgi:hypothetical protein